MEVDEGEDGVGIPGEGALDEVDKDRVPLAQVVPQGGMGRGAAGMRHGFTRGEFPLGSDGCGPS